MHFQKVVEVCAWCWLSLSYLFIARRGGFGVAGVVIVRALSHATSVPVKPLTSFRVCLLPCLSLSLFICLSVSGYVRLHVFRGEM